MPLDTIPHISLGTALLAIFLICLVLVMFRGIGRILTGTAVLAIGGCAGLVAWHHAPELSYQLFGKPIGLLIVGVPILAFACTCFVVVKGLRFVMTPFESSSSDEHRRPSIVSGLVVALIPTSILFFLTAGLLHHFGSIEELRAYATNPKVITSKTRSFLLSCKSSLDTFIPESVMRKLDPVTEPARLQAAKLVTQRSRSEPPPVIDPETGKPYPRAIVVDEPELQNLARDEKFGTLIRHPLLNKAINDPTVQSLIKDLNL